MEKTGSSRFLTLASIACGLLLIGVGIVEFVVDLPLMNTVTAVLVIASGLFLVVSSWWARAPASPPLTPGPAAPGHSCPNFPQSTAAGKHPGLSG